MSLKNAVKRPAAGMALTYARGTRNVIAVPNRKLVRPPFLILMIFKIY